MRTSIKNYSKKKCKNAILGEIEQGASGWKWKTIEKERNKTLGSTEPNLKSENKKYPVIILVLESPHSSEYKTDGKPIRPAMGKSGKNIYDHFCEILNSTSSENKFSNQSINLQKFLASYNDIYVWIVNSVQKQCSLGISPINNIIKESNWIDEWHNNGNDFVSNLDKITGNQKRVFFVINLCTKGDYVPMKAMVETEISKYSGAPNKHCSGPHPSFWGSIKKVHFE